MTYDPGAIRAALKTLLTTLTGVGQPIAFVYDYLNPKIAGHPAAIFDITNEDASMHDDASNLRVITFTIWITAEVPVQGVSGAKDLLDGAVKSVINTLELVSNQTLGNTVDWTLPVLGQRTQIQSPDGNIMYQEIKLRCNVLAATV